MNEKCTVFSFITATYFQLLMTKQSKLVPIPRAELIIIFFISFLIAEKPKNNSEVIPQKRWQDKMLSKKLIIDRLKDI